MPEHRNQSLVIIDDVVRTSPNERERESAEAFARALFSEMYGDISTLRTSLLSDYGSLDAYATHRFFADHPPALPNVAEVSYPTPYVEPAINTEPRKLFFAPFIQYFPELVHVEAFTSARII